MSEYSKIGIVIPTLGERHDYLKKTISSSKEFGDVYLLIVAPKESIHSLTTLKNVDQIIPENQPGLPAAINWGFQNLPRDIQYIGWIGDDDLLAPDGGMKSVAFLNENREYVMTFGKCRYINREGQTIGMNAFGQWAVPLLRFGPDLIPQPGSIFRRNVFTKVGEIDVEFELAFDFDFFIRLSQVGKIKAMSYEVGSFRWHSDSKSVKTRRQSVMEASRVRRKYLPIILKPIALFWEIPVILATYYAGVLVTNKARNSIK